MLLSQNNGQPLVVYAPSAPAAPIAPISLPAPPSPPCGPAPPPPCGPAPPPPCNPGGPIIVGNPGGPIIVGTPSGPVIAAAPSAPSSDASDLNQAQALADQSIVENGPLEAGPPQSDQPCNVETSTEVIQSPGETFVHQPGEILISQPPTRLVINHAPYIVRPAPIVLNQGGKTITNAYTRKIMPGQIQYRPVIVRIVKPIERKVLIDKPNGPCGSQSYVSQSPIPNPCDVALAPYGLSSASASAPAPVPSSGYQTIAALPPSAYGVNGAIDASSVLSQGAATAADQASLAALLSQANLSVSIIKNDSVDFPNIYKQLVIKTLIGMFLFFYYYY